ncbi:MAG: 4-(cytidine 5'-diphospho)-2-C-methyl-D-erythritol kinase [Dehalococcoidia bacterium]|nr:4-(cytidine 5'-diphospho)-2-C-methyl-D-erythritol kinase [Dehalococcoidia bacterium]
MLSVSAPAKINLVLEVLGKQDGYHLISSIVQSVDLSDDLHFELAEEVCLTCDQPSLEHDNLVTRAANLLRDSTRCSLGARIELRKRIPWSAGLGGGSSDAAATLLALNRLWGLGLPFSGLVGLADRLGSDVPFFMYGGAALVEGRGEQVTPLPALAPTWFILLVPRLPRIEEKTKRMYGKLDATDFTDGRYVQQALSSLRQGRMLDYDQVFNVFERAAFDLWSDLGRYRDIMISAGATAVHLAGSGPCLFAPCSTEARADEVCSDLRNQGIECYLTRSLTGAAGGRSSGPQHGVI